MACTKKKVSLCWFGSDETGYDVINLDKNNLLNIRAWCLLSMAKCIGRGGKGTYYKFVKQHLGFSLWLFEIL